MAYPNYEPINWQDKPELTTPLAKALLNHADEGINNNRDYINELDDKVTDIEAFITSLENAENKAF